MFLHKKTRSVTLREMESSPRCLVIRKPHCYKEPWQLGIKPELLIGLGVPVCDQRSCEQWAALIGRVGEGKGHVLLSQKNLELATWS